MSQAGQVPRFAGHPDLRRRWSPAEFRKIEFCRRAVELARLREKPIAQVAKGLGIAGSWLRNWMARAGIDEGKREGVVPASAPLVHRT